MTSITINNLDKRFGDVAALSDINLNVKEGEFFTLLGPSGCGKTTLLRTIAGFYRQDRGDVLFGTECVNTLPAYKRDTGMVFQNYAVFPHMTVYENVAYGLKVRKLPKTQIEKRVEAALKSVHLAGYEKRTPDQLSGGQQQRVGLARAMAIEPRVLLFDEPLSNLDAKLRIEMREEIRAVQKQLGITALYVTHDQEEALVISDRIAVMSAGKVQQIGTPREVYADPTNVFVATFVGKVNIFDATLGVDLGDGMRDLRAGTFRFKVRAPASYKGENVKAAFRPEDAREVTEAGAVNLVSGTLQGSSFLGPVASLDIVSGDLRFAIDRHRPRGSDIPSPGESIFFSVPVDSFMLFDPGTGVRLRSDGGRP